MYSGRNNQEDSIDLSNMLADVNLVAVLAAWIVIMVWSFAWYSKSLAGEQWMKEVGVKESELKNVYASRVMPIVTVLSLVSAFVLAVLLSGVQGWFDGLFDGLFIGVGISAIQVVILYAFALRSLKLMLIDAVWVVLGFGLMGLMIGIFT